MDRRAVLRGACACAALAALAACRRGAPPDDTDDTDDVGPPDSDDGESSPSACVDSDTSVEGWYALALADHPALDTVGGHIQLDDDDALLHILVAQPTRNCFVAVWRVCTHGACELGWQPTEGVAECPCHGSQFAADGAIVRGPATRPVRAFPALRRGDTLWIDHRR